MFLLLETLGMRKKKNLKQTKVKQLNIHFLNNKSIRSGRELKEWRFCFIYNV